MTDTINILLLGETGVGKSTWINSFYNYITYDNIESAEKAETLKYLIPTQFTITDENYEEIQVSVGESTTQENTSKIGQSATQSCTIHSFQFGSTHINLVDTPGMGDSRGVLEDVSNMENIMKTIGSLKQIHGICILLKPNEARLTLSFKFCIQEILCHLHKEVIQNIVFGFTNTRANFYRPGESLKTLRSLVQESLPERSAQEIKLNSSTIFCFDSESFRYVAALKHGVTFTPEESESLRQSWVTSNKEALRMVDKMKALRPHEFSKTVNLFKVRKTLDEIVKPVVNISRSIDVKIVKIEETNKDISNRTDQMVANGHNLVKQVKTVKKGKLDHLAVVCSNVDCSEVVKNEEEEEIHYKTVCHDNCKCWGQSGQPVVGAKNESTVLSCSSMKDGNCKTCGHQWQYHIYIDFATRMEVTNPIDVNVGSQLLISLGKIAWKGMDVAGLEKEVKALKDEKSKIQEVAAKLTAILSNNAIDDVNDSMADYVDHLIKSARQNKSQELEQLEEFKNSHATKLELMKSKMANEEFNEL